MTDMRATERLLEVIEEKSADADRYSRSKIRYTLIRRSAALAHPTRRRQPDSEMGATDQRVSKDVTRSAPPRSTSHQTYPLKPPIAVASLVPQP